MTRRIVREYWTEVKRIVGGGAVYQLTKPGKKGDGVSDDG